MSNSQVPGSTSAPGRRTFLASTAVAAAAVAGGTPLLSGCSAEEGSGKGGATSGKELKNLLPTYAASTVADPDIPSVNGSSPGYTKAPPAAALVASVKGKPGHGGSYTMFEPLWGTPPPKHNAYYQAVDDALGAKISLQPQDGNTYGEKLGAVLLNHGRTPAVVPLPSPRTDLLTGRAHHTGVRLDGFAAMVLAPPDPPADPSPEGTSPVRRTARTLLLAPLIALLALIGFAAAPAQAATWSSSDQWGTWSNGGYTLYNNIWGSGAGAQTIWANSSSDWGVWANHPNTGGIKSYPNAKKVVGKKISAISTLTSTYNVTVPSSGAYNTSYDIWDTNYDYEIMLWVNKTGPVGPLGTAQGDVSLGGHTWSVYKGSNGANEVFSFIRTSNSASGSVDIKPIVNWIKNTKGWFGDVTIGDVQFGYEITSSAGGLDFRTNSFGVSAS